MEERVSFHGCRDRTAGAIGRFGTKEVSAAVVPFL